MSVSVCIPTYRRSQLLRECIESCFKNAIRPLEIIISNDDPDDEEVISVVNCIAPPPGIAIVYTPNIMGVGQSTNVNSAISLASYPRIVLMHDDDFFLSGGIDYLDRAWQEAGGNIDAVFGRQRIVDAKGVELAAQTLVNNEDYHKLLPPGRQKSALWSALTRQLPNNGYMVSKSLALAVMYPSENEVGRKPVDFHFGIRLAQNSRCGFWMIEEYVSCYRLTEHSILRGSGRKHREDGHLGYEELGRVKCFSDHDSFALQQAKRSFASAAITGYLEHRNSERALELIKEHSPLPISYLGRIRLIVSTYLMYAGLLRLSDAVRHWRT